MNVLYPGKEHDLENVACWLDSEIVSQKYKDSDLIDCAFATNSAVFWTGSIQINPAMLNQKEIAVSESQNFVRFGDYSFDKLQLNRDYLIVTGSRLVLGVTDNSHQRNFDHLIYPRPSRGVVQPPIHIMTSASLMFKGMTNHCVLTESELILAFAETRKSEDAKQAPSKNSYELTVKGFKLEK